MYKIIAFFIIKLFAQLYVRVGILLTRWKAVALPHHFTKRGICAHKTNLPPPFLLKCMYQVRKLSKLSNQLYVF